MIAIRKLLVQRGGATAVEFGLTAPLFMMLVFGIIEVGFALWAQYGLENAVEAASRCVSVNTITCSSASAIAEYAHTNTLGVGIPASAFAYDKLSCGNKVTGSYRYGYFTQYFNAVGVTLTAQSCFPDLNAGG
jgi:Flp pilus assembly protein TadG